MGSIVSSILSPITGAGQVQDAANQAAASQREAATNASYAAQFRPVGMTTAFGSSQFTREIDPKTGMPYISSAGYTANPQLANLQNQLMGGFGGAYNQGAAQSQAYAPLSGAAGNLFNLGGQYLATSPEQARADYMANQQAALAPGREQQLAALRNQVFQTGRSGLATGGTTTGMGQSNPELQAYYNSIAQQNLGLAAQAEQAAQQRQMFGAGLFGTGAGLLNTQTQGMASAYSPLQSLLGLSGNVEQLSQQPYTLGMQLGTAAAPGSAAGAQMYNQGFGQAAATQYGGAQQAANLNTSFLSSLIGSAALAGAGGAFGAGAGGGSAFNTATNNWFTNPASAGTNFSGSLFGGGTGAFTINR